MGDDAEYYIEQQGEEARNQERQRLAREDQISRERLKRERATAPTKGDSPGKQ
jgi:hypothetical protein